MNRKLTWTLISAVLVIGGVYIYSPCPLFAQSCISNIDIEVDDVITFDADTEDGEGGALSGYSVSYSSSNSGVASVSDNGNGTASVTGQGEGTANITTTASKGGENFTSVVSVDVTEPAEPTPEGLIFHSDWSTATGNSDSAFTDSSKDEPWVIQVTLNWSDIIASTGLDFPTANVLRVGGQDGASSAEVLQYTNIPVPDIGESIYYRWYFRYVAPHGVQGTHPIQDGNNIGATNWSFNLTSIDDTTYRAFMNSQADAWPNNHWGKNLVYSKSATYRWELQVHRIGANTYNMHVRVYNSSGTLLYDDDDMLDNNGSGVALLSSNPTFNFNNLANLNGLRSGVNGFTGGYTGYAIYAYQGAFCVRTDTWCGPYSGGI